MTFKKLKYKIEVWTRLEHVGLTDITGHYQPQPQPVPPPPPAPLSRYFDYKKELLLTGQANYSTVFERTIPYRDKQIDIDRMFITIFVSFKFYT
jgi:hypothetical protein